MVFEGLSEFAITLTWEGDCLACVSLHASHQCCRVYLVGNDEEAELLCTSR